MKLVIPALIIFTLLRYGPQGLALETVDPSSNGNHQAFESTLTLQNGEYIPPHVGLPQRREGGGTR
ncbi:MAG: hypothetical protein ACFB8W_00585 [Elainellaceae cyanobacterium]